MLTFNVKCTQNVMVAISFYQYTEIGQKNSRQSEELPAVAIIVAIQFS